MDDVAGIHRLHPPRRTARNRACRSVGGGCPQFGDDQFDSATGSFDPGPDFEVGNRNRSENLDDDARQTGFVARTAPLEGSYQQRRRGSAVLQCRAPDADSCLRAREPLVPFLRRSEVAVVRTVRHVMNSPLRQQVRCSAGPANLDTAEVFRRTRGTVTCDRTSRTVCQAWV